MIEVRFPDGALVPAVGQGTWRMGEAPRRQAAEVAALREGIERGLTLIDTAELYADGGAETVVGRAIAGQRERVFLVGKVAPQNASAAGVARACAASLERLGTDYLDLYLLHWRGHTPLAETVDAFEALRASGRIRRWGVSNFDLADMEELVRLPGGEHCATNQILYHPEARGGEFDLLPWCRARRIPIMAYSPLGQAGRLLRSPALATVGLRRGISSAKVALAWSIRDGTTIAIPKAVNAEHIRENATAGEITLTPDDLADIDAAHKPPRRRQALKMI